MDYIDLKSLKSGTDIRGTAVSNDNQKATLTPQTVNKLINGFCIWLKKRVKETPIVAVGCDSRISSENIKAAVIDGLVKNGFKVYDCSLSSTPAMFMTTVNLNCNAAIEITASHHPFDKNGLKFFTTNGGVDSCDIDEIISLANETINSNKNGKVLKINYMNIYSEHLKKLIKKGINSHKNFEKPLTGFKFMVDAGNGVGGFYAEKVLKPLGADISGSQFLNPDGMFPNHIPNPENDEAIFMAKQATLASKADLGIIFDTDVDRAAVIYADGTEINKNRLIALAAAIELKEQKGATIVTDSTTSNGLKDFIENFLFGVQYRFKRGYKNVINKAKELNENGINCPLAIETSGHAAFRENYFLDDGAYLVTKIIIELVKLKKEEKSIKDLIKGLSESLESIEHRININSNNFKSESQKIIEQLKLHITNNPNYQIEKNNFEGLRANFFDNDKKLIGWFLVRMSVHDPLLVINIESDKKGYAKIVLKDILQYCHT